MKKARKSISVLFLFLGITVLASCHQKEPENVLPTENTPLVEVTLMEQYLLNINGIASESTAGIRDDGLAIIPLLEVMKGLGYEVTSMEDCNIRITCGKDCFILDESAETLCPEDDPNYNLLLTPPGETRSRFFTFESEECYVDSARLQLFFQKLGLNLIIDHGQRTISIQPRS